MWAIGRTQLISCCKPNSGTIAYLKKNSDRGRFLLRSSCLAYLSRSPHIDSGARHRPRRVTGGIRDSPSSAWAMDLPNLALALVILFRLLVGAATMDLTSRRGDNNL